ncbi:MAG: caspase family protein [Planctomycetaceae bacterium]|nr:caspase family protein [Planctomycetaceae bacterium]
MLSRWAFMIAAVLSCAAQICADDSSKGTSNTTAVFRPVAEQAPSNNAAMFVGINEFSNDPNIPPLRFAVHDAVELAHLFVVRLKLIPAANCHVALSGTPFVDSVNQHLTELKRLGVHVIEADKADVLKALLLVRRSAKDESNLLIISISSHGFDDGTVPYVMPTDGLRDFLADTAIRLQSIEEQMQLSHAGHRLFLVDACQEKVSFAPEKAIATKTSSAMNATFAEALKQPTGQAKLTSCDVGEFSYEFGGLRGCGHGVFTATLLDALDGGAPADEEGLIRMRAVADFVHNGVNRWIEDMKRTGGGDMKQSPAWFGPKSAEALPLAVKAGDVVTLITNLKKQKLPAAFSNDLRDQLIVRLEKVDASSPTDRELLNTTRSFLDGQLAARLFVPYLRDALKAEPPMPRPGKPALLTSPVARQQKVRGTIVDTRDRIDRNGRVGVIQIPAFRVETDPPQPGFASTSSERDVEMVLADFAKAGGVDALILDLRGNHGGSLTAAVNCTGQFVDQGPIAQVKMPDGRVQSYDDPDRGMLYSGPMLVLCDSETAAEAEVFAGAIKDCRRGIIVGDSKTRGAGVGKSDERYYRVNGDSILGRGVHADVPLPSVMPYQSVLSSSLGEFDRIAATQFVQYNVVSAPIVAALKRATSGRIDSSQDFRSLQDYVDSLSELPGRASLTITGQDLLNSFKLARGDLAIEGDEAPLLFPAHWYNDEILNIALDYVHALQQ